MQTGLGGLRRARAQHRMGCDPQIDIVLEVEMTDAGQTKNYRRARRSRQNTFR